MSIFTNSIKLSTSVSSKSFAASSSLIFNLWAPLAAKLVVPVELSNKLVSSSGVTISSIMLNPTDFDGNGSL